MSTSSRSKNALLIFMFLLSTALLAPVPSLAAPCAQATSGETALAAAGNGLAEGAWCEFSSPSLNWSLIQPSGGANCPNENHLEYASKGVYDPIAKIAGILTGPHSGTVTGACFPENIVFLVYDETKNAWHVEDQNTTGLPNGGHGYDLTAVDPATGDMFVSTYNTNSLWRRKSGGSWQLIGDNPIASCKSQTCASGTTWDQRRNGYIRFGDSTEQGVTIWDKSAGTWSHVVPHSAFGGFDAGFHFWAAYHRSTGKLWLQDGNGSRKHWVLNTDNTVKGLGQPPISLGCCGSNGRISTYDFRTDRFVVAEPATNNLYDFDLVADKWTNVGKKMPLSGSTSALEMFVIPIDAHGGLLMYVIGRGTGSDPEIFIYKHSGEGVSVVKPQPPDNLSTESD